MTTTRNKLQATKPSDNIDVFDDPYDLIINSGNLDICSKDGHKKKNCSKHPWCPFGFNDKEGIWSKTANPFSKLGEDPSLRMRQIVNGKLCPPCGLRNLGATCYLNVLIQSLFQNQIILDAVFNMRVDIENASEDEANMHKVVFALQRAFVHMGQGVKGIYNLNEFVELLGINSGEQQDPQEFNKLFFEKIESLNLPLLNDELPALNKLISGCERYCTVCQSCQTDRGSDHDFHELDLSIAGMSTLEEAIDAYLTPEMLIEENQYECQSCGGLRNAERCTVLKKLPVVLCIHLLRYTYDKKTFVKKKLQSDLTFPADLVIQDEEYKLVAVLYHKGRSAHGGHYVCDTLDWSTGDWWHCDDDNVTHTTNPADFPATNSHAASNQIAVQDINQIEMDDDIVSVHGQEPMQVTADSPVQRNNNDDDDAEWIDTTIKKVPHTGVKRKQTLTMAERKKLKTADAKEDIKGGVVEGTSSAYDPPVLDNKGKSKTSVSKNVNAKRDAYMLSYVRKSEYDKAVKLESYMRIPAVHQIQEEVEATSVEFKVEIDEYKAKCRDIQALIDQRKLAYQELEDMLLPRINESFHVVSAAWLSKWIRGDSSTFPCVDKKSDPNVVDMVVNTRDLCDISEDELKALSPPLRIPTVNNMQYICEHGMGLNVSDLDKMKVISNEAFDTIFADTGDDATRQTIDHDFTSDNIRCDICYDAEVGAKQTNYNLCDQMADILAMVDAPLSPDLGHSRRFKVSKPWLTQFRKYHDYLLSAMAGKGKRSAADVVALITEGVPYDVSINNVEDTHSPEGDSRESVTVDCRQSSFDAELNDLAYTTNCATHPPSTSTSKKSPAVVVDLINGDDNDQQSAKAVTGPMDAFVTNNTNSNAAKSESCQPLDSTVNGSLMCVHKCYSSRKISQIVSRVAWEALKAMFPHASTIAADEVTCEQCQKDTENKAISKEQSKKVRVVELENPALNALFKAKKIYPVEFDTESVYNVGHTLQSKVFYLAVGTWLANWRAYFKNIECERPPIESLVFQPKTICQCKKALIPPELYTICDGVPPMLFEDVNFCVSQSGELREDGAPTSEIITEVQWHSLIRFKPDIAIVNRSTLEDTDDEGEVEASVENASAIKLHWDKALERWQWTPDCCTACLDMLRQNAEQSKIIYDHVEIKIRIYKDQEKFYAAINSNKSTGNDDAAAQGLVAMNGGTRATRSRNSYKSTALYLSSNYTIETVKMNLMTCTAEDLFPAKQRLFNEVGDPMDLPGKTLGDYRFKMSDTLYVLYDEQTGDADDDVLFHFHESDDHRRGKESGFGGSALGGRKDSLPTLIASRDTNNTADLNDNRAINTTKEVVDLEETQMMDDDEALYFHDAQDWKEQPTTTKTATSTSTKTVRTATPVAIRTELPHSNANGHTDNNKRKRNEGSKDNNSYHVDSDLVTPPRPAPSTAIAVEHTIVDDDWDEEQMKAAMAASLLDVQTEGGDNGDEDGEAHLESQDY